MPELVAGNFFNGTLSIKKVKMGGVLLGYLPTVYWEGGMEVGEVFSDREDAILFSIGVLEREGALIHVD